MWDTSFGRLNIAMYFFPSSTKIQLLRLFSPSFPEPRQTDRPTAIKTGTTTHPKKGKTRGRGDVWREEGGRRHTQHNAKCGFWDSLQGQATAEEGTTKEILLHLRCWGRGKGWVTLSKFVTFRVKVPCTVLCINKSQRTPKSNGKFSVLRLRLNFNCEWNGC